MTYRMTWLDQLCVLIKILGLNFTKGYLDRISLRYFSFKSRTKSLITSFFQTIDFRLRILSRSTRLELRKAHWLATAQYIVQSSLLVWTVNSGCGSSLYMASYRYQCRWLELLSLPKAKCQKRHLQLSCDMPNIALRYIVWSVGRIAFHCAKGAAVCSNA